MAIKKESSVQEPVILNPNSDDIYSAENITLYLTSLSLYKTLFNSGKISKKSYCQIKTKLAQLYGFNSTSIYSDFT